MNLYALHKLSYGLYILTTEFNNTPYGCIINTAFQVTSEPPQIAISCNRDNYTHGKIMKSEKFGISVLAEDTAPELIGTFGYNSGRDINKFTEHPSSNGAVLHLPLLSKESIATFECRVVNRLEVGTHTIFIGKVEDCNINRTDANEMTYKYYREKRKGVAPKNAPTYIRESNTEESWKCSVCGYVYDKDKPFTELGDDWVCPVCGAKKRLFHKD